MKSEPVLTAMTTEARRIEEDCLYSGKGHFEAGRLWGYTHYTLGIFSGIFSFLAFYSASINNLTNTAIFAAIGAALVFFLTFLNASERASQHRASGTEYFELKDKAHRFYEIDTLDNPDIQNLRDRLEELATAKHKISKSSQGIPRIAYWLAKRGIQRGEADYDMTSKKMEP